MSDLLQPTGEPEAPLDHEPELFTVNLGPHHPATHGVLRLMCTLEGEIVRELKPVIGYVHTGIEKSCEDQSEALLNKNEIWLNRTRNVGVLSPERLQGMGVTGPLLRCAGVPWDLRKAMPYSSYEDFDFKVPVGTVGDHYDRYRVRIAEM